MVILLAVFAVLGIFGGGAEFIFASTVFQEIVGGMVAMTGFICLIGAALLGEVMDFRKQWIAAQERSILQAESAQKSAEEMLIAVNRLRMEQEQTNRWIEWLGEMQQSGKPIDPNG